MRDEYKGRWLSLPKVENPNPLVQSKSQKHNMKTLECCSKIYSTISRTSRIPSKNKVEPVELCENLTILFFVKIAKVNWIEEIKCYKLSLILISKLLKYSWYMQDTKEGKGQ